MSQEINTNQLNNHLSADIEQAIQTQNLSLEKKLEAKANEQGEKEYIFIENLTLQQITICSDDNQVNNNKNKLFGNNLEKMLFRCACSYFIGVLLWIAANEKLKFILVNNQENPVIAQNVQLSSDDSQFIKYLAASLKAIEQQQQQQPKINQQLSPTTEQESTANNKQNTKNDTQKNLKLPATTPSLSLANAISQLHKTQALPPPLYLSKVQPILPVNDNISPSVPSSSNLQLVGLLASGDRSVALFTINGITQSIKLGEKIGSTDWTLTSITEKQAIINRNGELLYMAVGEQF